MEELNILLEWADSPTKQISVTSSSAICALLKRPEYDPYSHYYLTFSTEFTLSQQTISEKVMSSPGVLATLLKVD